MTKLALFGYSGHAFVVAEAAALSGMQLAGYYDTAEQSFNPFHLSYLGSERDNSVLATLNQMADGAIIGIGDNDIRRKLSKLIEPHGLAFPVIKHPASTVSGMAKINAGTFIGAGAKVNVLANIGAGAILNTGCIVEHECHVGDFAHIAPGAVLLGNVLVGENSFIGANAVVKQGVAIGKNVTIGAGAVVLCNVPDGEVWAGNPAKRLLK